MKDKKVFYKSKTVIGAVVLALVFLSREFDLPILEVEVEGVVQSVVAVLAFVFTVYGRMKATSSLSFK